MHIYRCLNRFCSFLWPHGPARPQGPGPPGATCESRESLGGTGCFVSSFVVDSVRFILDQLFIFDPAAGCCSAAGLEILDAAKICSRSSPACRAAKLEEICSASLCKEPHSASSALEKLVVRFPACHKLITMASSLMGVPHGQHLFFDIDKLEQLRMHPRASVG